MRKRLLLVLAAASLIPLASSAGLSPASGTGYTMANRAAPSGIVSVQPRGTTSGALPSAATGPVPPTLGTYGCNDRDKINVRANQDCTNQSRSDLLGRSQAQNETSVAVNPKNPKNVLISQNDYRRGDGACGADFSFDGGYHFGSELVPMSFTAPGFRADRHYWDASGDTSVGFDSTGEAYLLCQAFNRGSTSDLGGNASGFFLFRSSDGGASWSFPGNPVQQSNGRGTDNIGLLDKQYMVIDNNPSSPYRDRIYVAWANYNTDFTQSPIFLAYSADHGRTWHHTGDVSGRNATLCPLTFTKGAKGGKCNVSQFADPFVAPNGDVYVTFVNFNNCAGAIPGCSGAPGDNHNQVLISKSTDGGRTFSGPRKVMDYYDLPDCATYTNQDVGRSCVPTAPLSQRSIFRAANYPASVALSNTKIAVTMGSYINRHSNQQRGNCVPNGLNPDTFLNRFKGVGKVNGCNNDIVLSQSTNAGALFTGTTTSPADLPSLSNETNGRPFADQWFQWAAKTPAAGLVVSYYDRKYDNDQSTGEMDMTMRRANGDYARLTDQHLPPLNEFPDTSGFGTFLGDYTGLAVGPDGMAHPAWADTRNPIFSYPDTGDPRKLVYAGHGSDIYTRTLDANHGP